MKVDLVMWTKNGASTLPLVLKQINSVIPSGYVSKRIIVDDRSSDKTRVIAGTFGWQVLLNKGSGISDGANTALDNVEEDYFISFEQDLVLSADWWRKVPSKLADPSVAVASGIRLPNRPAALRKFQEYVIKKYEKKMDELDEVNYYWNKTIDNTIYKTEVMRKIGGFPKLLGARLSVDNLTAKKIRDSNLRWVVDYSVRSVHLRKGLLDEMRHNYWYGTEDPTLEFVLRGGTLNIKRLLLGWTLSPFQSLKAALKMRDPQIIYVYPLIRFSKLRGTVDGLKKEVKYR